MKNKYFKTAFSLIMSLMLAQGLYASKLYKFKVLDSEYLMLWFYDGEVKFVDDGQRSDAFTNYGGASETNNYVLNYGEPLSTDLATNNNSYSIVSENDADYGETGLNPVACYRKSKINGMAEMGWLNSVPHNNFGDYEYIYTYQHWIYVKLPSALKTGHTYTINIDGATHADTALVTFTFDEFNSPTEAIHTNVVGFNDDDQVKAADVYHFMGDGGARDYSNFEGNKVYLYNTVSQDTFEVGNLTFWMQSNTEAGSYDYIKSKVWHADFTGFTTEGNYRLVVEGIGCSEDFVISNNVYSNPYSVMVQGYYYMRAGEDSTHGLPLVPRRPLWIPGENPGDCKVLITTMSPFHPEWGSFTSGDRWDQPDKWARFVKDGNPENPNAIGGHVDALDWDRHLGHVSNIYDMLLPYILTNGNLNEDNTNIAESGNGIPDIIDEARNEVDLWLNLRDGIGYSHGLTNPTQNTNILYQAGTSSLAAFANAFNASMLAHSLQLAGKTELMQVYTDSAIVAYNYGLSIFKASNNYSISIGDDIMDEEDFIFNAAAFLYNLTGDKKYEDKIKSLSRVTSATSQINKRDNWNQLWGTAAYLTTNREVHYPELFVNMRKSIIHEAKTMEANWVTKRASRRSIANNQGYYQTMQAVQRTILAHAFAETDEDREFFEDALILEADWSLGRNPANMIQMTTATTPLATKRSVQNCYTNGRNDGVPGLNPGHTPYFNPHDWYCGMIMGCPGNLIDRNYPQDRNVWPQAELFYNTRYVWAHVEFTPRQTMRGKIALYGYLHGLAKMQANNDSIDIQGLNIYPDTLFFYPDNERTLLTIATPANASNNEITWYSKNDTIATVNENGVVKANQPGQTVVYAEVGSGLYDSCLVTVQTILVSVTSVELNQDTLQMREGWQRSLLATVYPQDASDTSVYWYSADDTVASVSDGMVTANAIGETYIYAKTINEGKIDSCLITVVEVPDLLCHLSFNEINQIIVPDESGNENNGKAFGGAELFPGRIGNAIKFAGDEYVEVLNSDDFKWNQDNSYSVSFWVFVNKLKSDWTGLVTKSRDESPWSGLWISQQNKWHSASSIQNSSMTVQEKIWYHVAIVQDVNEGKHKLYINSEKTDEGSLVSATGNGNIWIGGAATTTEYLNGMIDELKIYSIALSSIQIDDLYNAGLAGDTEVSAISLNSDTLKLDVGATTNLEATIVPSNALDQRISWESSNTEIATVDAYGKVNAISAGQTTISVVTFDGSYNADCEILVNEKVGVTLNPFKEVYAYPNPANSEITIAGPENINVAFTVRLINSIGKVTLCKEKLQINDKLGISDLPSGMYLLSLESDKTIVHRELIIKNEK